MGARLKTEESTEIAPAPIPVPSHWPRPSISEYGPRVVRITRETKIGSGILAGLAATIAIVGGGILMKTTEDGRELVRDGKVVVTRDVHTEAIRSESRKYWLYYKFPFNGQVIEGRAKLRGVPGRIDSVALTVLPRNPSIHRVGTVDAATVQRSAIGGGTLVLFLTGLLGGLAWLIRVAAGKEGQILTHWIATSALVLESKASTGAKSGTSYRMKLRYRVPRQADMETEATVTRQVQWTVEAGTFLDVLYDPEDPSKARVRDSLTTAEIDHGTF